jgi:3-dehydroquinate synthase/2-deoxy-scyllo-inosose synthase
MQSLSFVFADKATVPGYIGTNVKSEIISHILDVKPDKILLVCDSGADAHHPGYFDHLPKVAPEVSAAPGETGSAMNVQVPDVEKIMLPEGDAAKSWDNLTKLIQWSFDIGATKRSLIVAFGGGALLNVAGLFASILFRGSKLIYVPTTFLAMHDVVTSMKTSICYDGRKNNIGSFYAPLKILIDLAFCHTLPRKELFSGLGELAKNALLFGGSHVEGFVSALSKEKIDSANGGSGEEFIMDDQTLMTLTSLGIEAKMMCLKSDAYERTSGMLFEYGHTVSHAIEKAYGDGVIPHGLGVTYGMLSSSYVAECLAIMSSEDRKKHDEVCWLLLKRWPLPEPRPTVEKIMSCAMRDSKRGITAEAEDEISDVLLRKIGEPVPTRTNNLSKFPCKYIRKWLSDMGFPLEDLCKLEPMSEKESTALVDLDSSDDEQPDSTRYARWLRLSNMVIESSEKAKFRTIMFAHMG